MLKKTKIICTQGPATERPGVVDALIANGMNCARFNFSHGDHAEHLNRINMVREAAKKAGKVISLILDTKGPEMRLGEFKDGKVMLEKGNQFTLTYEDVPGDETHVSVNHKGLYTEVKPGDTLLLSDGLVALKVDKIRGKDIITEQRQDEHEEARRCSGRIPRPAADLGAGCEGHHLRLRAGPRFRRCFLHPASGGRPGHPQAHRGAQWPHGDHAED